MAAGGPADGKLLVGHSIERINGININGWHDAAVLHLLKTSELNLEVVVNTQYIENGGELPDLVTQRVIHEDVRKDPADSRSRKSSTMLYISTRLSWRRKICCSRLSNIVFFFGATFMWFNEDLGPKKGDFIAF